MFVSIFIFLTSSALAENSNNIVQNLKNIDNLSFNFEQNIILWFYYNILDNPKPHSIDLYSFEG